MRLQSRSAMTKKWISYPNISFARIRHTARNTEIPDGSCED